MTEPTLADMVNDCYRAERPARCARCSRNRNPTRSHCCTRCELNLGHSPACRPA